MRKEAIAYVVLYGSVGQAIAFGIALGKGTAVTVKREACIPRAEGLVANAADALRKGDSRKVRTVTKGKPFQSLHTVKHIASQKRQFCLYL